MKLQLEAHWQALVRALEGREVTHIAVSHTHRDHSPLARRLKEMTGALTVAEGPHRAARPLHFGEANPFAESSDTAFLPDIALSEGDRIAGDGWTLEAVLTPVQRAKVKQLAARHKEEKAGIIKQPPRVPEADAEDARPPRAAVKRAPGGK